MDAADQLIAARQQIEDDLIGIAMAALERDRIILGALRAGITKNRVHELTGVARSTIDAIIRRDLISRTR